eukprot:170297-Prorocentrum_lima.AAC.1
MTSSLVGSEMCIRDRFIPWGFKKEGMTSLHVFSKMILLKDGNIIKGCIQPVVQPLNHNLYAI